MELYDWLVGIGGVLMLISSFFHFYSVAFTFPLIAIGLIVLVILDKIAHVEQISEWSGLSILYIIVGAVGALFALLDLLLTFTWRSTVLGIAIHVPVTWYITPVLSLLASVAVLVGGIMRKRDVDVGGGRVARPPAGYQQPYQQQQPPYQQPYQQPPQQQPPYQPPAQPPQQQPPYQPPPQPPQGGQGGPPQPPQTPWQ
jgi:hypothetical protein